jgi:hypothetical protein
MTSHGMLVLLLPLELRVQFTRHTSHAWEKYRGAERDSQEAERAAAEQLERGYRDEFIHLVNQLPVPRRRAIKRRLRKADKNPNYFSKRIGNAIRAFEQTNDEVVPKKVVTLAPHNKVTDDFDSYHRRSNDDDE